MKGRSAKNFLFLLPAAVLYVDFLGPVLALRKSFVVADFSVQHWPWAKYFYDALRAGRFPFWTDAMAGGFPLAAEGQIAAFYGPHRILAALLPFWAFYSWSIALHFAAGALGFYLYARALRLSRAASGFSTLAYAFGSAYAGCYYNTGSLRTLAWLPLLLWAVERMPSRPPAERGLWGAAAALAVSQMWQAGFAQIALYAFGYVFCAALLNVVRRRPGSGATLGIYAAAVVFGTLLAAPQLTLSWELIGQSVRRGESAAFALWGSMPPTGIVSVFFPEWGNVQRISFYAGLPAVFAAAAFFALPRAKKDFRHVWLCLVFLLLALGKSNPLYAAAVEGLSLTFLRNPAKFLFFAAASYAIVAGQGLDAFCLALKRGRARRFAAIAAALAASIALMPAASRGVWRAARPLWDAWSGKFLEQLLAEKGPAAKPAAHYEAFLGDFYANLGNLFSYGRANTLASVALALVCGLIFFFAARQKISRRIFLGSFFIVCLLDFHRYGWNLGTGFIGNTGPLSKTAAGAPVKFLQEASERDPGAVAEFVRDPANEFLPPDRNMAYGLSHVGGYSPLLLKEYYDLTHALGVVDGSVGRAPFSEEVWRQSRGLLDLIGVKFLATDAPVDWEGFTALGQAEKTFFYRNALVLPEAAAWTQARVLADPEERLRHLRSAAFDPRAAAVVGEDPGLPPGEGRPAVFSIAEVQKREPGQLQAIYTLPAPGIGWARIAAYPGWRLRIDGKPQSWFRAGHAFIGFRLEPGAHLVQLAYVPSRYREALAVSALAAVLLLLVSFRFLSARRHL